MEQTRAIDFIKMQGLGNDFVIIDARDEPLRLDESGLVEIADRRLGVGCDQVLVIDPPANGAAADMRIFNPDGSAAEACGNGTRCVARLLMEEKAAEALTIRTVAGDLICEKTDRGVRVDMGLARTEWNEIPLRAPVDTLYVPVEQGPLKNPVAVNVGNPHLVFFVDDVDAIDLPMLGPLLEHDPILPERGNIEIVQVLARDHLRMRVWERSAGITRACGSGACAAAVAAHRRGYADRASRVTLDGGDLYLEWLENGRVTMTGPTAISFTGSFAPTGGASS
ncbi:MAG: diaminopimelate epimerase [Pseudomonadota bacterium]